MAIHIADERHAEQITRKVKVKTGARSVRQLASAEHMNAVIQRETARSDRNSREFSLVLFRVRPGKKHAASTIRLARTILTRARATDEVGWFDDQFLCAVLPDTLASGAWHFAEDVCAIIAERAPRPIYAVYSYPSKWFNSDSRDNDNNAEPPHPRRRASDRRAEVNELIPHFLNGVNDELKSERTVEAKPLEPLLVRPMPWWKRTLDIVGALFGIILFSPIMILTAILIKICEPGGSIIFTQERAGLGGKPFKIYKFRTMIADAEKMKEALRKHSEQDGPAFKMKNDPRVTRLGRILRKTSIDELPQLFNVLKGDMTLVGPRPLPLKEADGCQQWQRRRLDVTPGLTCIWQVRGRSTVSFADWVRMDVAYIRRRTFFQDIRILLQTIPAVLLRRGAS